MTDSEVQKIVEACQIQLDRDFYPIWGITAQLHFDPSIKTIPSDHWALVFLDNSDAHGALGYHDLTASGMPLAKVFAGDDKKYGLDVGVTASHELLEMMGDPDINLTVFVPNQSGGMIFAFENADAVEDDSLAYDINGVKVSDFVFPSWFNIYAVPGTKFDFCGHVSQPFEILPGGYIGVFDISNTAQGWTQIQAQGVPARTLVESQERKNDMRGRLTKRVKTNLVRSVK
jgi:hypothetical protein